MDQSCAASWGMARLRGLEATETLALLYEVSRLYINFFQPSFKLKSKTRHGATGNRSATKRLLTPLERVLRSASIPESTKRRLRTRFRALDPLDLLRRMRERNQRRRTYAAHRYQRRWKHKRPIKSSSLTSWPSLGTAWHEGEIRATHHRSASRPHLAQP